MQFADTLINFELPWNPAKKNQRIGRIDRLGRKSGQLTIINLIMMDSIEQQISSGLLVKQSLFDGVLSDERNMDYVDFTSKGRSQFIQQLEDFVKSAKEPEQQELATDRKETPELPEEQREELDFSGEEPDLMQMNAPSDESRTNSNTSSDTEKLEEVMNHGMQFLAGMFKMSTGKELGVANQSIEVDKESGEVTMKFKLPV